MNDPLTEKKCLPCEGGVSPLSETEINDLLSKLTGWQYISGEITKTFLFKNYLPTIAFVNAVAWIAEKEGHHPDLEVSYNRCKVRYSTHAIQGISENDFICAAKIDAII